MCCWLFCSGIVISFVYVCEDVCVFIFKQKTAYEMRISDWSSDVCSSDLDLDPARTLFVVTSKTFTTAETLANARTARAWYLEKGGTAESLDRHFVAISTNASKIAEFGLDHTTSFAMWDWVGGRYPLWYAVGLPIALASGHARFAELVDGPPENAEK